MKKKWMIFGSAVGISSVVMVATGFTALAGNSGYEAYKFALKNTKTAKSVSIQAEAMIQDNGTTVSDAKGNLKVSLENHALSGSVTIAGKGKEQTLNLYNQKNGVVWKSSDSDVYVVKEENTDRDKHEQSDDRNSAWMSQQAETVIDALIGNLKNEVSAASGDNGSQKVSLQLEGAQIPAALQALAPLAFHALSGKHEWKQHSDNANDPKDEGDLIKGGFLEGSTLSSLTQDIQIKSFGMSAVIDSSQYMEEQQVTVTFTGKDAQGTAHEITLNADAHFSGYNATSPDSIDLTGKQVKLVKDNRDRGSED